MRTLALRTNLFCFDVGELPPLPMSVAGPDYVSCWNWLEVKWRARFGALPMPIQVLVELLAVASQGPAWVSSRPLTGVPAIVTARPIQIGTMNRAFARWSQYVLSRCDPSIVPSLFYQAIDNISTESLTGRAGFGYGVPPLPEMVPWLLADLMSRQSLLCGRAIKLRLTSTGTLLAWDDPVRLNSVEGSPLAMHAIQLRLRGLDTGTHAWVSVDADLVHVARKWSRATQRAWAQVGNTILTTRVRLRREQGQQRSVATLGRTIAQRSANTVIPSAPFAPMKVPDARPIGNPEYHPIGEGCGPLFLDAVCWHFRKTVQSARPQLLSRVVGALRAPRPVKAEGPYRLVGPVLVVGLRTRSVVRVMDAAKEFVANNDFLAAGSILDFKFVGILSPELEGLSSKLSTQGQLDRWFNIAIRPTLKEHSFELALIEVCAPPILGRFPKLLAWLRRQFAMEGICVQFIECATEAAPDYPLQWRLLDLVRQTGELPRSAPCLRCFQNAVYAIGIWLEEYEGENERRFLPVVARVALGTNLVEVLINRGGSAVLEWTRTNQAICSFHTEDKMLTPDAAIRFIDRAIRAERELAHKVIVYWQGRIGRVLGQAWSSCLAELGNEHIWWVRVRGKAHGTKISGDECLHADSPGYVGKRTGLYRSLGGSGRYYFVYPSRAYSKVVSQRKSTRYDCSDQGLLEDWHQLEVSEFTFTSQGAFGSEEKIALQTALLCKRSPAWPGEARLPLPLFMAMRIASEIAVYGTEVGPTLAHFSSADPRSQLSSNAAATNWKAWPWTRPK